MQNNIINNKPRNNEELEKIIIQTAQKKLDYLKIIAIMKCTQTKKIKEDRKLKIKAKKKYKIAIIMKTSEQIKNKFD